MLRPASRSMGQIQLWENMWNDEFVKSYRMFDRWAQDTLPLAGEYFRQTTKDLMWDNKLYERTMTVGGRRADISRIKVPILHAVAEHDHIVPYDAAKPLIADRRLHRQGRSHAEGRSRQPGGRTRTPSSGCGRNWTPG